MPNPESPAIVRISTRIYSCLLWLCPRPYRREYGALMEQAFRDLCCDAHRQGGAARVLRAWPRAFLDVCSTAAAEHRAGLRVRARELRAVGVALLFVLIAAALVPILRPAGRQGNGGATQTAGDTRSGESAPRLRTALALEALPAGGQAIVANTAERGGARFSIYMADGQVITLDGTQPARIELGSGSRVVIFSSSMEPGQGP